MLVLFCQYPLLITIWPLLIPKIFATWQIGRFILRFINNNALSKNLHINMCVSFAAIVAASLPRMVKNVKGNESKFIVSFETWPNGQLTPLCSLLKKILFTAYFHQTWLNNSLFPQISYSWIKLTLPLISQLDDWYDTIWVDIYIVIFCHKIIKNVWIFEVRPKHSFNDKLTFEKTTFSAH